MTATIIYGIAMSHPHTHLYQVTITLRDLAGPTIDLALPVWTPGSYMVREYARHVQEFAATSKGVALAWWKLDKSTWHVVTDGAAEVCVTYQVYANELTVRTSHLDGTHGYFNPATLCMYIPGRTHEPVQVQVYPPEGWQVTTGLPSVEPLDAVPGAATFAADDFDALVDSPFECGTHRLLTFTVDTIPHHIALWGHGNEDEQRLIADTRAIVVAAQALFGRLPYRSYTFIVHLMDGRGGGLEHRNSVTMQVDRWTFQPRSAYARYLELTAHEFFHVWNVKRIRPEPLGPFDYSRENYTRQLWISEGITDYYTERLLLRAGLITAARYREQVAEKILYVQGQPGRALQSLEQGSFDAWIKHYRPDEHSPNSTISYYIKGDLVGMLLDLELLHLSNGTRSLDDMLRYFHDTYPIDGPGFPEDRGYFAAVEAVVGASDATKQLLTAFHDRYIAGTEELDYAACFTYVGLRLEWGHTKPLADGSAPPSLRVRLKTEAGHLKITHVLADGAGYVAGIYAGDELLALDGFRVSEESLQARLAEHRPGDVVTLSLFRRDELLHIPVTLGVAPYDKLTLMHVDQPTPQQRQLYERWIGPWDAPTTAESGKG